MAFQITSHHILLFARRASLFFSTSLRIKPKRGLSASSLRRVSSLLPKTPPADPVRPPASAISELEDGIEQRRCGFNWSAERIDQDAVVGSVPEIVRTPPCEQPPTPYPTFEDFRQPETPPAVFGPVTPLARPAPPDPVAEPKKKKRPKMGSRNVSFSKSLLNIRKESQASVSDGPTINEDAPRRGSLALTALSSGTVSAASGDIPEEPLPVNSAVLEDPVIKKALTRSSTTSSVEDWLGLKKSKPDLRICNLADAQEPVTRRRTFSIQGKLPRISSFRTESEFRAQKKQQEANAAASTVATKHDSISDAPSTPITPPEVQPGLWAKKERPRFLRSRSKKSLASLPTTPNADVHDAHDPMSDSVDTLATDDKSQPKSPSNLNGGLLWQPKPRSRDESPKPVLAKSRRTGTFDEPVAPPSQQLPRSPGVPDFKIPDMRAARPEYLRYPSSQISPRDDTEYGLNHHLLEFFEEGMEEQESTKEMTLKPPEHKRRRVRGAAAKSRNYLPTEARRINTPPVVKPGRGNRLMEHFWDSKVAGVDDESATMNLGKQHIHTPFPMPADTSKAARIAGTASAPSTPIHIHTRGADWYRARADDILDEDEQVDSLEELKAMFDWDVPEHLPTSPLCPAHPKHKSGGTGICVYHGRGKKKAVDLLIPEGLEK